MRKIILIPIICISLLIAIFVWKFSTRETIPATRIDTCKAYHTVIEDSHGQWYDCELGLEYGKMYNVVFDTKGTETFIDDTIKEVYK